MDGHQPITLTADRLVNGPRREAIATLRTLVSAIEVHPGEKRGQSFVSVRPDRQADQPAELPTG